MKKQINNIEQIEINKLVPAEYNPRRLTKKQHDDIKASLQKYGFLDPVIVNTHPDRQNVIIGGHQRVKVWKSMGNDTAPCVLVACEIKEEQELNVRLNKNTGEFDWDMLANHFDQADLIEWGFEPHEFGVIHDLNAEDLDDTFTLDSSEKPPFQTVTFSLSDEQMQELKEAIKEIKATDEFKYVETYGNENGNGNALYLMVTQWQAQKKLN